MTTLVQRIQALTLPRRVQRDLTTFCEQLLELYGDDLLSLTVIGSAAGTTYREQDSDLNLLVVYSDLNVADLAAVAGLARTWLKRRRFAPRFLSRRNLLSSAGVFALDTLDMLERRAVLFGEDLVAQCSVDPKALGWQVSSELKSMRLRVKQQFWRAGAGPRSLTRLVAQRYGSLRLLARGLLVLTGADPGSAPERLHPSLAEAFGLSLDLLNGLEAIRRGTVRPTAAEARQAFANLMEVIRVLDDRAEGFRL